MSRRGHLRLALKASSDLQPVKGLGALRRTDVNLIIESERQKVDDSLDLDAAMQASHPNENRWDYLLSLLTTQRLIALEPHPAKESEIASMIAKRARARSFLDSHLQPGHSITRWIWVSPGATRFSRMERAQRLLAQHGIDYVGNYVRKLE